MRGRLFWFSTKDARRQRCGLAFFNEASRRNAEAFADSCRKRQVQRGYEVTAIQVVTDEPCQ